MDAGTGVQAGSLTRRKDNILIVRENDYIVRVELPEGVNKILRRGVH